MRDPGLDIAQTFGTQRYLAHLQNLAESQAWSEMPTRQSFWR